MNDNPFKTPPEWDTRTGWGKLRDGWRRGWRTYDSGLKRMGVSHLSGCLTLFFAAFTTAMSVLWLLILAYELIYYLIFNTRRW